MQLNRNRSKALFLALLKFLILIIGLNIFLTTVLTGIDFYSKRNNSDSEINFNIKKLKYNQNVQFD